MNKLLNNLLGMYKQAKLAKKAVTEIFDDQTLAMVKGIFADEQNYPTAEDITEALRSLNTNGDLSDEQYDYIQNNWEEFLKFSSKQAKLNKKAEEKESAKKDYTEQYAKVKEIMKEYGYGLSDGGYIYLISKEQPKDEGFQVKFKGDRLRVELDGKLKYSGYGPEAIEDFLKGMFYAKKLSSKNTKLTKKAGYSNNPNSFGDWFGKGQIDFSKIINPNDSGDVWMVKLWGGKGYILDVYLVKADDYYDAVDKVFEWSYENEGANNIVFDRENLEEEALEYFKDEPNMFGKELEEEDFIDRFLEEYYVANEGYSLFAREENFFADQVPEEYLKGNKQSSKAKAKIVRKQAGIDPNVSAEDILKLNFDMPIEKADKVKEQFNEKGIKYQSRKGKYTVEFSVDIEAGKVDLVYEIIRNIKKSSSTKKQATIKHENGVYNVYSESGKCLGKGYKTKEEAEKRLKQVEYFKHKKSLRDIVISKMAGNKK